jgi:two-component system, LytTR family, response regulator
MIKAIIVDDQQVNLDILTDALRENFPGEVDVCAVAADASGARKQIRKHAPDLVFLDIEMPDEDGFELLESLPSIGFSVIFVTSYEDYALKAFRSGAIDYLVKPVILADLRKAIQKVKRSLSHAKKRDEELQQLIRKEVVSFHEQYVPGKSRPKIMFPYRTGVRLVPVDDIVRAQADDNYCNIFLNDRKKLLVSKTLKSVAENLLRYPQFFRTHKSHIINFEYLSEVITEDFTHYAVLQNGERVEISRRNLNEFNNRLEEYGR